MISPRSLARALSAALLLALGGLAAPAMACTPPPPPRICTPSGECSGPAWEAYVEQRAVRAMLNFDRDLDTAIAHRRESAGINRAFDIARIIVPNLVQPVAFPDRCGDLEAIEADASGAITVDDYVTSLRRAAGLPSGAPIADDRVMALANQRIACNDEVRRGYASYLASILNADRLHMSWDFLMPRSGMAVPEDGHLSITGPRLLALTDAQLPLQLAAAPSVSDQVAGRRGRAWQYLLHHRNGDQIMPSLAMYLESRVARADDMPAICPAAAAETARLMAGLVRN